MIVCSPVTHDGQVDPRWGRATRVAVADVREGAITAWQVYDVGWDTLHDATTEGGHHARVARFLREHGVEAVVAGHMGEPMRRMLDQLGVDVRLEAAGDARRAVLAATSRARD
jgi:predicted Fe-Mo cluster-binding NifX family protein